jgi:hypothetical protein
MLVRGMSVAKVMMKEEMFSGPMILSFAPRLPVHMVLSTIRSLHDPCAKEGLITQNTN